MAPSYRYTETNNGDTVPSATMQGVLWRLLMYGTSKKRKAILDASRALDNKPGTVQVYAAGARVATLTLVRAGTPNHSGANERRTPPDNTTEPQGIEHPDKYTGGLFNGA